MSTSSLLAILQQLHSLEIEISDKLIEKAKSDKDEESILFLVKNNKLDMATSTAALNGYLELLKYLISIGKYCTTYAMDWAARNGHLDVVKYLHSIGADCTTDAMHWAAKNGHLEVVKYLHSIGKPCNTWIADWAATNGHLEIVKYLHSIGKDCSFMVMNLHIQNNHTDVVDFLKSIKDTSTPVPDDTNPSYNDAITLITEARDNSQPIKIFII